MGEAEELRCEIICDVLCDEENIPYESYGVMLKSTVISNITTEYDFIRQLVDALESADVELCHCMDIIEDFLFEKTTVCLKRLA